MEKMENKNRGIFIAAIFAIAIITSMAVGNVAAQPAVTTQVAMILDGSGSIGSFDWGIIREGVASAVEDTTCVPDDGTVELTVVQFGSSAVLEVPPVAITSANAGAVANQIRTIPYRGGMTNMAAAFTLAADTLAASPNFHPSIKQALNIATDGDPNSKVNAVAARNGAIATLQMTPAQDEIDAEGIDISTSNRNWLRDSIVYPQPGYIAPPFVGPGWVRVVDDANEFAATVCEKFEAIIPPPSLCPDKYRWGDYEWKVPNTFVSRQEVHFVNNGQGDAYSVTAEVTCTPVNVVASEPYVSLGNIPAGGSAWSSSDTFELEIDMNNPQDPNKGICWRVEYDDAAGVHHVIDDVAKFCGERCSNVCP